MVGTDGGIQEQLPRKKRFTRKGFLKAIGLAIGAGVANRVAGLAFEVEDGVRPQDQGGFKTHTEMLYPAVSWVQANLAIASRRLEGITIPSGGTFSLLETLFKDTDDFTVANRDPQKGYVIGGSLFTLQSTVGAGLCKVATDLYRAAIQSPLLIAERYTHFSIGRGHPYFKDPSFPMGTDAAIYTDEKESYDLKIRNPWNCPVRIKYDLWDRLGDRVTLDNIPKGEITWLEYYMNLAHKYAEGFEQMGMPVGRDYLPDVVSVVPLSTTATFVPVDESGAELTKLQPWQSMLGKVVFDPALNQYTQDRLFELGGQRKVERLVSTYRGLGGSDN